MTMERLLLYLTISLGEHMRIKLFKSFVVIEVDESSRYFNFIFKNIFSINNSSSFSKLRFLQKVYYMCVNEVGYQNPTFEKKLRKYADKKLFFKKRNHNNAQISKEKNAFVECYRVLGSDSSATIKDIKAQYIRLAKKYHPDKVLGTNNKEMIKLYTKKFQQIKDAYDFIKSSKAA
jgi:hypothetical protein